MGGGGHGAAGGGARSVAGEQQQQQVEQEEEGEEHEHSEAVEAPAHLLFYGVSGQQCQVGSRATIYACKAPLNTSCSTESAGSSARRAGWCSLWSRGHLISAWCQPGLDNY